jgi:L-ascorbate metabolism protein UlaG (beta-lactamase superfamily)
LSRHRTLALALAGALVAGQGAGCTFAHLAESNAALLFRRPDPPPVRTEVVAAAGARIAATWIGHATVLLQLDDKFVLTDPVFTEYLGALTHRLVEPGLSVAQLPPLAAVVVSHRHLDHLSPASLKRIGAKTPVVVVPPGAAGNVPAGPYRVEELPRWESRVEDGVRITAVPVDHNGGRFFDRKSHPLAFTGYVIEYHGLTVYFPGDTAYAPEDFEAVARAFPRIDLALMPIGPIAPRLTTHRNHIDPAEALEAARLVGAAEMLPIHHDTFVHSLDKPGDCVSALEAALEEGAPYPADRVHVVSIGERWTFPGDVPLGAGLAAAGAPSRPTARAAGASAQ